jgi:RNA polymerase sigma-70 factor (ECF subfamily)
LFALALATHAAASLPPPSGNLEHLFQEHHGQIFGAAYRVTGSSQDAEDVLQTVFLRLLRREALDLSPSPGAYLHRAAVNASLDLMRVRGRSSSIPIDELDVPTDDATPDRRQQDRETRLQLRQAILALSPKSAEIFSLRFLEGLSNRDIAKTLGMTQTAVGVTLHRARAQVKKDLHAQERQQQENPS